MRRIIYRVILLTLITATSLVGYLVHYHNLTEEIIVSEHIDGEQANALKHTYAAAQLYELLTSILPDEAAEDMVVWLGHMNEYAEQWMRSYPKNRVAGTQPDTTIEIIKDLHNNRAGIAAARWKLAHTPKDITTLAMILRLVRMDAVVVWANKLGIPKNELDAHVRDVAFANAWVEQRREKIAHHTQETLSKLY